MKAASSERRAPAQRVHDQPRSGASARHAALAAVVLAALLVAALSPTLQHGFVNIDDGMYVVDNEDVLRGMSLDGVRWAFTTLHTGNWHPLTWLSLQLDVELWGQGSFGHHLTNLILHVAGTLLLFGLLVDATGATARSAFAAALFGIHPLHVESVAWISERKDVLSGVFAFVALWAYQHHARSPGVRRYALVALAFVLGLLAKPMLVTLPIVFLAWDHWPLRRFTEWQGAISAARDKVPLLALSAAFSIVTLRAQLETSVVALTELPLPHRLAQAATSTAWYLRKAIWPSGLAAFYPYDVEIHGWTVALSVAVLLAITLAIVGKRSGPWFMGWSWYLVMLLPVIGIVQVGAQSRADRYTYLPLTGIFIAVAWTFSRVARRYAPAFAVVVVALHALATRAQLSYWRDGTTLMERAVAVTERNWFAHNALGRMLTLERRFAEAEPHLHEAVRLAPENPDVWFNLGVLQADVGRWEEATLSLRSALRQRPDWAEAHYNLGRALHAQALLDDAVAHYSASISIKPRYADAYNNLAATHLARGDLRNAEVSAREAARIDPASPYPRLNLALMFLYSDRVDEARHELRAARALGAAVSPEISRAFAARGIAVD